MRILLAGLSHRTAPVEVRERLAIPDAELAGSLQALKAGPGVREALILSTCNRVEVALSGEEAAGLWQSFEGFLAARLAAPAQLTEHLYRFVDEQAIRHLFRVAASLDSMVLGEPQILGQLKGAYASAKACGALDGPLDAVLSRAFAVAKRVRSETGIGRNAVSVSYAAVELARQIFGNLNPSKVLLVGAGKMSELAARHLRRGGCQKIFVTNRTAARAAEMAGLVEGEVVAYEAFRSRLAEFDIVLTSSGATEFLLNKEDFKKVLAARRNRPVFVIDIAVPRNVDPAANELEHIFLYDIDDLGRAVEQNRKSREREAGQAEAIVEEEIHRLAERFKAREVAPTIVALQQTLDQLGQGELERLRARLGPLSPRQDEALAAFTRALFNKIAHGPITELRRASAQPEGDRVIRVIRRVFRLEE
jgi:glutamyl-tRNA reductase